MIVNPFLSSATELLSSKFWILKRNPAIIKHIPNEYIEKKSGGFQQNIQALVTKIKAVWDQRFHRIPQSMHKILTNMSLYQIITELEQYPADFTDSLVALSLSYSFLYATQVCGTKGSKRL